MVVPSSVQVIDPAEEVVKDLKQLLAGENALTPENSMHGHYTYLVTAEDIENFTSFTRRLMNTQTVDVRPLQVQVLIQSRLELKIFDITEPGRQPFY